MNKQKEKGTRWENEAEEKLNKAFPFTWTRIRASGAWGTLADIPQLKGDIKGKYPFMSKPLLGECKVGYGGKVMTIKKEWFDKVAQEAAETYSLPVVLLKFEQSRSGVKYIICMDFEVWNQIMEELEDCRNIVV